MILHDKNITTVFIVPTLGIEKEILNGNGFISGYLDDHNHDLDYEDVVYLLFKPEDVEKFKVFLDEIYEKNSLVIEDYNTEKDEIIVIFKLNEKYKIDYEFILAGKYSKVSEEFKQNFPKTVVINGEKKTSLQTMIFNKDPKLARYWADFLGTELIITNELELWPGVDLKKEILNYEDDKLKHLSFFSL